MAGKGGRNREEESSLIDGRLGECGYLLSIVFICGYFDFIEDRPVEISVKTEADF